MVVDDVSKMNEIETRTARQKRKQRHLTMGPARASPAMQQAARDEATTLLLVASLQPSGPSLLFLSSAVHIHPVSVSGAT